MPKILIVGSNKIFAIERYYIKYLRELGVNLEQFCAFDLFLDYYERNIFNKIIFQAGLSTIYKRINRQFKQIVRNYSPDIILIFKGMEILPESLAWAKAQNIKLVNYNPDNPFIFSGKGSGNRNITDCLGFYDLHLTYSYKIKEKLEDEYRLKALILPFAYNDANILYDQCSPQEEVVKLCFVGNPDSKRAAFLEALAKEGIPIDVFGFNWEKFVRHSNIKLFAPVLGTETSNTLRKYRVQLNMMRAHNEDSHNMRSFEVPGVGGIMVAPDTDDHHLYFKDGEEVFLYKGVEDCAVTIKKLLSTRVEDANLFRQNARQRSVSSGYSYKDRARQLWNYLKTLQKECTV